MGWLIEGQYDSQFTPQAGQEHVKMKDIYLVAMRGIKMDCSIPINSIPRCSAIAEGWELEGKKRKKKKEIKTRLRERHLLTYSGANKYRHFSKCDNKHLKWVSYCQNNVVSNLRDKTPQGTCSMQHTLQTSQHKTAWHTATILSLIFCFITSSLYPNIYI